RSKVTVISVNVGETSVSPIFGVVATMRGTPSVLVCPVSGPPPPCALVTRASAPNIAATEVRSRVPLSLAIIVILHLICFCLQNYLLALVSLENDLCYDLHS